MAEDAASNFIEHCKAIQGQIQNKTDLDSVAQYITYAQQGQN